MLKLLLRKRSRVSHHLSTNDLSSKVSQVRSYQGDPILYYLLAIRQLMPVQLCLLTLLLGFGVLSLWYWSMVYFNDPATHLRGLYRYMAASWGDSIVLPMLSLVVFRAYNSHGELFRYMDQFLRPPIVRSYSQKAWTALTVVFSAIGVIGFHAFSLYGTERNWTTPTYGQLNAPGWYHGLFMFAQLYLLIGFAIRQMVTVRLMWKYNISGRQAEAAWQINIRLLVWFEVLLGCFGGLLATDKLVASANAHMMLLTLMQEPTVLIELLVGLPLCLATLLTNRLFGKSISPLQILSILILSAAAPVVTIVAVHAVQ